MTATLQLSLKARIWRTQPVNSISLAMIHIECCPPGGVYQLPDVERKQCLDELELHPTGWPVTLDDMAVEVEYEEKWPIAGGAFTPREPFDYEIQRVTVLGRKDETGNAGFPLTPDEKMKNRIKRAIKTQTEVEA